MDGLKEVDLFRRKILLRLLGAGALAALPGCAGRGSDSMPREMPPNRSIWRIEGEVKVNDRPATLETLVSPGDTVVTGG
ncbi:MAG: hypothetical protein HUJ31_04840, partial [Pseudomonadales bacterium]|nr:hypothetical protein [Pseudomonadales bacterium]